MITEMFSLNATKTNDAEFQKYKYQKQFFLGDFRDRFDDLKLAEFKKEGII